ncbi:MAG: DUF1223 domain-containing protein [Pseudomonadota bacterium]
MNRVLIALTVALVGIGQAIPTMAADKPRAFLELFTSQGCASCPAADSLIGEFAERPGVIAVTMPVKLWDFLGWADTLASDDLTKRQIAYSVSRGDRDVFTPQLVVNGKTSVLGSDRAAIRQAIRRSEGLPLPISLAASGGVLSVSIPETQIEAEKASLWLLVVEKEVTVPIASGENRGRKLTYHNVVRHIRPIGMWKKGEALSLDLPLADQERHALLGCMVIAQEESFKGPGRIIGAASLDAMFPARTADPR